MHKAEMPQKAQAKSGETLTNHEDDGVEAKECAQRIAMPRRMKTAEQG